MLFSTRAKIAACVARGGIPDEDAPGDEASMRFWCSISTSESSTDRSTMSAQVQAQVRPQDLIPTLTMAPDVSAPSVSLPDPVGMVRNQLALVQPESAASSPAPDAKAKATPRSLVLCENKLDFVCAHCVSFVCNVQLLQEGAVEWQRQNPSPRVLLCLRWRWLAKLWTRRCPLLVPALVFSEDGI